MKNLNVSKPAVLVVALVTCFLLNCNRANALIVNVLAGVDTTATPQFNQNIFGGDNPSDPNLTLTDGDTNTYFLVAHSTGGSVAYDLTTPTTVNEFGIWEGADNRGDFATLNIDFSNVSDFSSGVTTDVVNLPNPGFGLSHELVLINGATAQYVRFDFLTSADDYFLNPADGSAFAPVSELELFFVPEPASLSLLGVGSLFILRRRRR